MAEISRYLLFCDGQNEKLVKLNELSNKDSYVTMSKKLLAEELPQKLTKLLAKNGLSTTVEIGLRKDKPFCFHRLVSCLYYNCLGKWIHHINKNVKINNITNLIPLTEKEHEELHKDNNYYFDKCYAIRKNLKDKLFKKRQTLASNDKIILEILEFKKSNIRPKKIIKKLKSKVKQTTIYKILKEYSYGKEFLFWLKTYDNKEILPLDEKFKNRWRRIIEFEPL